MKVKFFFALVFFLLTSAVFADERASVPSLSTLSQLAKEAVEKKIHAPEGAKIQITPQSLDSRLYPPPCLPPILSGNLCFVCKGDPVSIFAKTAGLEIKTSGEALSDGNIGETIRVKNRSSNRELDAQVTGIGEVEVRM